VEHLSESVFYRCEPVLCSKPRIPQRVLLQLPLSDKKLPVFVAVGARFLEKNGEAFIPLPHTQLKGGKIIKVFPAL